MFRIFERFRKRSIKQFRGQLSSLEWVKYGKYSSEADYHCALCNRTVDEDEWVLMNLELLPHPWLCKSCVKEVEYMAKEML